MKKNIIKSLLFLSLTLFSLLITAQDAPPSDDIFRLRNVETGKYLTDTGSSATAVTMTDSGDPVSTHFTFVQSGAFYNIDSEILGILRAPGSGGPGGPYVVVSTTKASPAADADKVWMIQHNQTNNTYRFQSGNSGRYMYHDANGTVTHVVVSATDDRSNWELVPYVENPVVVAPDEDTNSDLTCPASGIYQNDDTRNVDIPNSVNVGTADDRSCYSDYSESNVYGKTWGIYNITDGSNHWDGSTLQPRIERSLPRSTETGVGSFAKFNGTFRILEVGDTSGTSNDGTYIAQAKGKHTGGGGSNDPAICLYLAKPVYGTGVNEDKQVAFDIYAERILIRGGEGSNREIVFLKRVEKNVETTFEMKVGFAEDPSDSSNKIHYCNAIIGGEEFNWNIPEPERGTESGIRYGAYRVKGGRAQIRWANTTYQKVEVSDNGGSGPSDDIFRFRNVATGEFLTDAGSSATPVTMTNSGEPTNTHFTFVQSGALYNIDSETNGVLRAPGSGGPGGAYVVVSTTKASPTTDADKLWTVHHNTTDDTYRFESGTSDRYMYHDANGTVTHVPVAETDTRSVWEAIPTSQSLSVEDNELTTASLKVYPNPAENRFTIALNNIERADVKIYNMLGKLVYEKSTNGEIKIENDRNFTPGVYMIKVISNDDKTYHSKLIIK